MDVLSNDYAEMNLGAGASSSGGRSTGPTLSPKENIKKLKSSFFGCSKTDANDSDYVNCSPAVVEPSQPRTPRKEDEDMAGEYALMDPKLTRGATASYSSPVVLGSKKSILFTSNNNPDKVLANTLANTDGFKPISSNFDNELRGSKNQSPKSLLSSVSTSFNRQHSAPTQRLQSTALDNGAYELLELRGSSTEPVIVHGRLTRPNSVNSEKSSKHSCSGMGAAPFTSSTRPNSANSDPRTISASSSMSSSSMLCGSGANENDSSSTISTSSSASTILRPQSSSFLSSGSEYSASSRPSSVVSVVDPSQCNANNVLTSRPPSVSSERELHYSILDLPPCTSSSSINQSANGVNSSGVTSSTQTPEQPGFTYAQIDFVKSSETSAANTGKK